jgi:CO/xanthine dehydrogenase FAD-binding subunit
MATIGGNLFAEPPYGDLAGALLGSWLRALSPAAARRDPLRIFSVIRKRAGLIMAIHVPRLRDSKSFAFHKVSRVKPKGVSVMSFSAFLPRDAGRLRGVRIGCIGLGPGPLRAFSAERALEGQMLDQASISRASLSLMAWSHPTDALASPGIGAKSRAWMKRLLEKDDLIWR